VRMKLFMTWGLPLLLTLLMGCEKYSPDEVVPPQIIDDGGLLVSELTLGGKRIVGVWGVVRNESGQAVAGATVKSGWSAQQTTTDARGFFKFDHLMCYEKSAYLRITKPGYFEGSRSWVPTFGGTNRMEVQLLALNTAGSFQSSEGGTVQAESFTLVFPPNGIRHNGAPYSGNVSVYVNAIDPTDIINQTEQMPGSLVGFHNGDLRVLRSLGMAAIELRGSSGELLQPAAGSWVEMRCTIPAEMQEIAPATIPLWSLDETNGFWKYEGTANRTGNEYIGYVSHFSYWNFDVETNGVNYQLTVNYNELPIGFYALDNAVLVLTSAAYGAIPGTTGTNGQVSGLVPANEVMQLQIMLPCEGGFQEVYSASVGPFTTDVEQTIEINELPYVATIQGNLADCDGNASSGYVWLNDNDVVFVENGTFQITTCTGNNGLYAYCFNNGMAGTGYLSDINVSSGTSTIGIVCEDCFPIGAPGAGVTDIDGNTYPTVINGNQEWMASNLMTEHYSNGDAIAEVADNAQWSSTTTPAWCYFNNNAGNNVVFGKLYNGYAMEDSRNVCPTGWHVPSNDEWAILMTTLGGSEVAASAMRTTGTISEGTGLWPFDNVISNNVSGFSAQPAGFRNLDGTFATQIYGTVWWSNTLTANDTYYTRGVYSFSNSVFNQDFTRPQGFSIRCLRD
jgi:uncharacterized protein (TIGR02145 family)